MIFSLFSGKQKLRPSAEEIQGLVSEVARFKASDLYGRLQSQGGDYLSPPIPSDKKAATDLMSQLLPGESRQLVGRLEPCSEGIGLFYRGKKIDTLLPGSAKAFRERVESGAWVIFELTHVVSRDGERRWPSLTMKPGRKIT
jgi:hypothetical protein